MPYVDGFFTAAGVPLVEVNDRPDVVTPSSDPRTCDYIHFDLSPEQLGNTQRYNCWGFTFIPRRYWLGRTDVDNLLQDNCDPVPVGSIQIGDVIRYRTDDNVTQHTGRVWETDGAGHATWIRSKWGPGPEFIHLPLDVPSIYGTNLAYFRQKAPIQGDVTETNKIADLWIKDSPSDDGEQYSHAPWWTSPDILVDIPPYDGIPDLNPVFNNSNRVWAMVHNRTNQQVDNVFVRYYWADPAAGLAPANWNMIPGTAGHPNPAGPITINGNSSQPAPYVEWTPAASPAHQCLLAIAYINDNPMDSLNPDPLVYPFSIPWDNNIAQRNVHVIPLENGGNGELSINIGNPFLHTDKEIKASLHAVLTYSPPLPILGYPLQPKKISVSLHLENNKDLELISWDRYSKIKDRFLPYSLCQQEKPVSGAVYPGIKLLRKEPYRLKIKIHIPKGIKSGSIYYLHITQEVSHKVTGGYTVVIKVV